jgi:hypothetical protein
MFLVFNGSMSETEQGECEMAEYASYETRDIGYGVEVGDVELPALSAADWTGKREYLAANGETVYLFDDELIA